MRLSLNLIPFFENCVLIAEFTKSFDEESIVEEEERCYSENDVFRCEYVPESFDYS